MPNRVRVGVVGCGLIAQVMHLPHLAELPDRFELAALCDLSPGLIGYSGWLVVGQDVLPDPREPALEQQRNREYPRSRGL